jgi:hypothetical protein
MFGPAPDVVPFAMVGIGIRTGGFEADVAWARGSAIDGSTGTMGAVLRLGWILAYQPLELAFHIAGQVGSIWAGGSDDASGAVWGGIGSGLEVRVWLDEIVALSLAGDLLIPVSRFAVPVVGNPPAYELPAVTGALAGGVVVQVP